MDYNLVILILIFNFIIQIFIIFIKRKLLKNKYREDKREDKAEKTTQKKYVDINKESIKINIIKIIILKYL